LAQSNKNNKANNDYLDIRTVISRDVQVWKGKCNLILVYKKQVLL